jgi:hypothetical protein
MASFRDIDKAVKAFQRLSNSFDSVVEELKAEPFPGVTWSATRTGNSQSLRFVLTDISLVFHLRNMGEFRFIAYVFTEVPADVPNSLPFRRFGFYMDERGTVFMDVPDRNGINANDPASRIQIMERIVSPYLPSEYNAQEGR